MFAPSMTIETFFDSYSDVLAYIDEVENAYSLIAQRYFLRVSIVIPADIPKELPEDMLSYKVKLYIIEHA